MMIFKLSGFVGSLLGAMIFGSVAFADSDEAAVDCATVVAGSDEAAACAEAEETAPAVVEEEEEAAPAVADEEKKD